MQRRFEPLHWPAPAAQPAPDLQPAAPPLVLARPVSDPPAWTVHCGVRELTGLISAALPRSSAQPAGAQGRHLIVDLPWGFALTNRYLTEPNSLVVTQHPVPEYWDDLWELGAGSLLVGDWPAPQLQRAADAISAGRRWRAAPASRSLLCPRERLLLRCLALGWTAQRIGLHVNSSEKTVRNTLSRIFATLGVRDRKEAALYYWGLLERVVPGAAHRV